VHFYAQRFYCNPEAESGANLCGLALKVACWPVFCRGLWLALGNRFLRYVPTSKRRLSSGVLPLCWPLLVSGSLTAISAAVVAGRVVRGAPSASTDVAMLAFSLLSLLLTVPAIVWAFQSRTKAPHDAWNEVPSWLTTEPSPEPEIAFSP
jgi:hypothetical protein